MFIRRIALVLLGMAVPVARPLAQGGVAIRGEVTSAANRSAISGATVRVADSARGLIRIARTGEHGEYSVPWEGAGSVVVTVTAIGYAPQRRTATWERGAAPPPMPFAMEPVATPLAAVRTVEQRPRTRRSELGDAGVGGNGVAAALASGLTGDLTGDPAAALLTLAAVGGAPDGTGGRTASVFGVPGDQNGLTLNGLPFAASVPRDGFAAAVVTSTYDATRGGFAGLQTSLRMLPGSNLVLRSLRGTLDAQSLQWTPEASQGLGNRRTQRVASGAQSGSLVLDRLYYATSVQYTQGIAGLPSLSSASPALLATLQVSPDSVARLLTVAQLGGIPLATPGLPGRRLDNELRGAVRFDLTPNVDVPVNGLQINTSTTDDYYLQAGGSRRRTDGVFASPLSALATQGARDRDDAWLQLTASRYTSQTLLNETTLGASRAWDRTAPYLAFPSVRVQLLSAIDDGRVSTAQPQLGGAASPASGSDTWTAGLRHLTSWSSWSRRHAATLLGEVGTESFSVRQEPGPGTFTFNSVADLAANLPASYTRELSGGTSRARGASFALAASDVFTPEAGRSAVASGPTVQYGVRVEGSRVLTHPDYNAAVDSIFQRRTDHAPSDVAVLPMIGFNLPLLHEYFTALGTSLGTRATLSGGVRQYRGVFATRAIEPYLRQTGLPNGSLGIACVGDAVPRPAWDAYAASPGAIPTACADNGTPSVFAQRLPSVALLAPDNAPLTSWRPALELRYRVSDMLQVSLGGTAAYNAHLPTIQDLNFTGAPRFTLDSEGDRPVFVTPEAIVPATGALATSDARLTSRFGRVLETSSPLRSVSRTVTVGLAYAPAVVLTGRTFSANVQYARITGHEESQGFLGSTGSDPRLTTESRLSQPAQVVTFGLTLASSRVGSIQLFGRAQGGIPYTPMVSGDVNGDGFANDRAFIFDPARAPADVAAGLAPLLAAAPAEARQCLERQRNTIAARNSCTGPWALTNLTLQIRPEPYHLRLGNRGSVSVFVNNLGAGLDQLLHGGDHLHGWGQFAVPDQTLLTVRGFDPQSRRYLYVVNPQFGSSSAYRNAYRVPFSISVDVRMEIGPDRETQYIKGILTPRQRDSVTWFGEPQIRARIARSFNLVDQVLVLKDSLGLTPAQVDSMRAVWKRYSRLRDSVATGLSRALSERKGDYDGEDVRQAWHGAGLVTYHAYVAAMRELVAVLTPDQVKLANRYQLTYTILDQARTVRDADIPWLFRRPMITMP